MPRIKYALEKGQPKRLEISWKGNWKEFTIRLDGEVIGSIDSLEQLKAGQEFLLKDGSCLKVWVEGRSMFSLPKVSKDGQPLHPSGLEPTQRLSNAYRLIFIIGGLNLAIGVLLFFRIGLVTPSPIGLRAFVAGVVFLLLGFFVMRKSMVALAVAMGILGLDVILSIVFPPALPRCALIAVFIFKVFILLGVAQGIGAVKALRQNRSYAN